MTAAFRAKTRMCPLLETAYIQNPIVDKTLVKYTPGNGWKNPICSTPGTPVLVQFIIKGTVSRFVHSDLFMPNTPIISPWSIFASEAGNLDGNVGSSTPKLIGLLDENTKYFYPYGNALPQSGGTFTPSLSY